MSDNGIEERRRSQETETDSNANSRLSPPSIADDVDTNTNSNSSANSNPHPLAHDGPPGLRVSTATTETQEGAGETGDIVPRLPSPYEIQHPSYQQNYSQGQGHVHYGEKESGDDVSERWSTGPRFDRPSFLFLYYALLTLI